jgi:hypothetical protein
MGETNERTRRRERVPADHPDRLAADAAYRHAASRGEPLSQRITPSQVAQVRAVLARRDMTPAGWMVRAGLDVAELSGFTQGVVARSELPDGARRDLGVLTREAKTSGALWPRKTAAIVWALVTQTT